MAEFKNASPEVSVTVVLNCEAFAIPATPVTTVHPVNVYPGSATAVIVVATPRMQALLIRVAKPSERMELEQLQLRASLGNAGDRDALLAHPDAIQLDVEQITRGRVFVSEFERDIVGFASIEPRDDGDSELDAMFVEPRMQRRGIGSATSRSP